MKKSSPPQARFWYRFENFWFQPVSAAGFGFMRVGFGFMALITLGLELPNVERFYGPTGIFPREAVAHLLRSHWRFSILDYVGSGTTHILFAVLLLSLVCVTLGLYTKRALLVSIILLYSFHEYAQYLLDGGDTLLRLVGFILLVSPCHKAMSLDNLWKRIRTGQKTGKDQDPAERTMPIWPYRLLLWQMIILYAASGIEKWSGETWRTGSAVAIGLHHEHFSRVSPAVADILSYASPAIGYFTLFSQSAWVLLLVLPLLIWVGLLPRDSHNVLKRALLLCGVFVHLGIFLLMDVGTFSFTVFASYLGLLLDQDFRAIRKRLVGENPEKLTVLFDGRCGFCKASAIVLRSFDWLHRLEFLNLHDAAVHRNIAPRIPVQRLQEEMHVKDAHGKFSAGFYAFRVLSVYLPPLWPLLPLLFIPGVSIVGVRVYAWVARHRA